MLKQHDCSSAARNTASRRSFTCLRVCTRALGKISFGAGKPDSVPPRQVGASVVISLRPTLRRTCPPPLARERACKDGCGIPAAIGRAVQPPILPCTGRGFSCRHHCWWRGGLLLHLFTLTFPKFRFEPEIQEGGLIFCDTVRRLALKRGARTWLAPRAASCPAVSGLSSPNLHISSGREPTPGDREIRWHF